MTMKTDSAHYSDSFLVTKLTDGEASYLWTAQKLNECFQNMQELKDSAVNGVTASELGQAMSSLTSTIKKFDRCMPKGIKHE